MDKRQNFERNRADGSGTFSPRSNATPLRSSLRKSKAHAACTFAILVLALPLAAHAAESGSGQLITLDVAGGGALGAVCTALVMWLNNKRNTPRTPPLGEDVARTYATKQDLADCRGLCRRDIVELRESLNDNDRQAEARAKGTHARIDAVYKESLKVNKSLGMLIGIMIGKGQAPASIALQTTEEG